MLRGSFLHERDERFDFLSDDGSERRIDEDETAIVMEMLLRFDNVRCEREMVA